MNIRHRFCLYCISLVCGCSLVFADSTGILASTFSTQYATVQQQFTLLRQDIDTLPSTGSYAEMISLLSCMQIPVPTNDVTYNDLFKKLKSDFDRDFATIPATGSSADMIRLDFYAQSLASLKSSLVKDRQERQSIMQGLVAKNQSLFNQLSVDKKLLDSVFLAYTDWSQNIMQYKALYGYTINQYDAIIANYTVLLNNNIDKQLTQIMNTKIKKNTNLIGFSDFAEQQKKIYLNQFSVDRDKFFSEQVGGLVNADTVQDYQAEVDSIKSTYYSGSILQCGLLTSLNKERRSYYQELIMNLKSQQQLLKNTMNSSSGSVVTGSSLTGMMGQGLFTSGSQSFIALNDRYAQISNKYQNLYTTSLESQISLLTKVARSEQETVAKFSELFAQYKTSSGQTKIELKAQLVGQVSRFEKDAIVSLRAQQSLERIKKGLNMGQIKHVAPRTIRTRSKK